MLRAQLMDNTSNQSKAAQTKKRRVEVAELSLMKKTQLEIADLLGVDPSTICRDLKAIGKMWDKQAVDLVNAEKKRMLDDLRYIRGEALDAWLRSMEPKNETAVKKDEDKFTDKYGNVIDKVKTTTHRKKTDRDGDPRFLAEARNAINKECEILGIDAPDKVELTGKAGGSVSFEVALPNEPITE